MTKIVIEVLAVFMETATEVYFIEIFRNENLGKHLFTKFHYDCNRDVFSLLPLLDIENTKLLYAYFDELVTDKVKHNHFKDAAIRAAYERDEKERQQVMASLQQEADRALEIQKAYEQLPEKARSIISQ